MNIEHGSIVTALIRYSSVYSPAFHPENDKGLAHDLPYFIKIEALPVKKILFIDSEIRSIIGLIIRSKRHELRGILRI